MRHDKVVEADHEPDLPSMTRAAPRQTPGAATQGRDQPTQRAIPAFHEGRLDRRAELAQAQLLAKTAWTTADHAPTDLHNMASRIADLDAATFDGLVRVGDAWETPGYPSMTNQADLSVTAQCW